MPLHSAPRRASLITHVTDQLRAQIRRGEWPVGSRIPTEPELVSSLGVGRNTVREAVQALMHVGMLERRQGSGTFVTATTELAAIVGRRLTEPDGVTEALAVRRAFEVEGARLAAAHRTDDDLAALDAALHAIGTAWDSGDVAAVVDADVRLHQTVLQAAHNAILAELYAEFGAGLRVSVSANIGGTVTPDAWVDHSPLVEAIRARDAATAATTAAAIVEPF